MNGRLRNGGAALVLVTLAFATSAALRTGVIAGEAFAAAEAEPAPSTPLICPEPPIAVAEALSQRESRVAATEMALRQKEAALALTQDVVNSRIVALEAAEAKLAATLAQADGAAENDVARLTEVYQNMKPKEAAQLFELMDADFAAGFLGRMEPAPAAAILSGLSPDKGYAVSVLLAGRNANAPKE
jgi:flagellar motility protein MotE (MotC chaperone)